MKRKRKRTLRQMAEISETSYVRKLDNVGYRERLHIGVGHFNGYLAGYRAGKRSGKATAMEDCGWGAGRRSRK